MHTTCSFWLFVVPISERNRYRIFKCFEIKRLQNENRFKPKNSFQSPVLWYVSLTRIIFNLRVASKNVYLKPPRNLRKPLLSQFIDQEFLCTFPNSVRYCASSLCVWVSYFLFWKKSTYPFISCNLHCPKNWLAISSARAINTYTSMHHAKTNTLFLDKISNPETT